MQHCRTNGVPNQIYKSCFSLWTEYFANRYSYFDDANLYDDWRGLERLLENFAQLDFPLAMEQTVVRFAYALGSLADRKAAEQAVEKARLIANQKARRAGLSPPFGGS